MKINRIGAVIVVVVALLSCRSEAPKEAWQTMDYPVLLSLQGGSIFRADQTGTTVTKSLDNERAIENLTVLVFTNREANNEPAALEKVLSEEQIVLPSSGDLYNGKISFDLGLPGTYYLEVIANGYKKGDAVEKAKFLAKFPLGMTYGQFTKVVLDRPLPEYGDAGFTMLTTDPVKVVTHKDSPVDVGKIALRRFACRFDLFNKLEGDLELTEVVLKNQINKSFMLPQTHTPSTSDSGEKRYKANGSWFSSTMLSGGIYSYENPTQGATTLQVYGKYKNVPWQKNIVFRDSIGNTVKTERNCLYRIYLTKGKSTTPGGNNPENADRICAKIEVLDWSSGIVFAYTDQDVKEAEQTNESNL